MSLRTPSSRPGMSSRNVSTPAISPTYNMTEEQVDTMLENFAKEDHFRQKTWSRVIVENFLSKVRRDAREIDSSLPIVITPKRRKYPEIDTSHSALSMTPWPPGILVPLVFPSARCEEWSVIKQGLRVLRTRDTPSTICRRTRCQPCNAPG